MRVTHLPPQALQLGEGAGSDLEAAHTLTRVYNCTLVCFSVPVSEHVTYTHAHTCLFLGRPQTPSSRALFSQARQIFFFFERGEKGEGERRRNFDV